MTPRRSHLPEPKKGRGQEHVRKAGDSGSRVGCGPATPDDMVRARLLKHQCPAVETHIRR